MAGTASLEIDATLLTIRPLDECQVWSKYFGETKVSSRCTEAVANTLVTTSVKATPLLCLLACHAHRIAEGVAVCR